MSKQTAKDLALGYFNAWHNKDFDKASGFLSDNISFEMPINAYNTKDAFLQAVAFTANAASDVQLLASFGNGEEAVLLYVLTFQGVSPLTICEHFRVRDEKIVFIRHIHDTYKLRNAGFKKS